MPDHDDLLHRKLTRSICYELETVVEGYSVDQVLESIAFAATAGAAFVARSVAVEDMDRAALEQYLRVRLAELVYDNARDAAQKEEAHA